MIAVLADSTGGDLRTAKIHADDELRPIRLRHESPVAVKMRIEYRRLEPKRHAHSRPACTASAKGGTAEGHDGRRGGTEGHPSQSSGNLAQADQSRRRARWAQRS